MTHFDLFLSSPEIARELQPDLVIQLGGPMVSKSYQRWLGLHRPARCVRINSHPERDDPGHLVSWRIQAALSQICEALAGCGTADNAPNKGVDAWFERVRDCQERSARALDRFFSAHHDLIEPAVARYIAGAVEQSDGLFLGSSMPIRDAQRYASACGQGPVVFANRGASGIDGSIATVAGAAFGSGRTLTAIVGDLAALHDLNSLALLRTIKTPTVLVIINNNGGGIFHFLPVSSQTAVFDPYFTAPHGLSFKDAAALFGLPYAKPDSMDDLKEAYTAALEQAGATLIEITTGRAENVALHKVIDEEVFKALQA
jgi:2-succinyl-5-enolpyruvyl-6-hydroxy-3-cyclohexene-1-carboxylate synthase